ncbi:putative zinc ribbon protein [Enterobacter sp. UPMP2060]
MLCDRHYYGNKRCSVCHSGDHSIPPWSAFPGSMRWTRPVNFYTVSLSSEGVPACH